MHSPRSSAAKWRRQGSSLAEEFLLTWGRSVNSPLIGNREVIRRRARGTFLSPLEIVRLVRLRGEDQKIIHPVAFHEILDVVQFVSGSCSFANEHIFIDAMILPVAVAINDANLRSWLKRQAKVTE